MKAMIKDWKENVRMLRYTVYLALLFVLVGCSSQEPLPIVGPQKVPTPPYLIGTPVSGGIQLSWSWLALGQSEVNSALEPQAFELAYSSSSPDELERLIALSPSITSIRIDSLPIEMPRFFSIRALHADGEWYPSNTVSLNATPLSKVGRLFPTPTFAYEGIWQGKDGEVIYTNESGEGKEIFSFDPANGQPTRIRGGGQADFDENSGRIVYVTDLVFNRNHPDSSTFIGLWGPDGFSQIILGGQAHLSHPVWASHGRQLAFLSSEGAETSYRLWVSTIGAVSNTYPLSPIFSELSELEGTLDRSPLHPAWNPTDEHVLYDRLTPRTEGDSVYFVRDINQVGIISLMEEPVISSQWNDICPAFSPDGSTLAYISDRSGLPAIWLRKMDGSHTEKMIWWGEWPRISLSQQRLSWHPDGGKLLFTGWENDSIQSLFIVSDF